MVQTGNMPLSNKAKHLIQCNDAFQTIRTKMGAIATGFTSENCMCLFICCLFFSRFVLNINLKYEFFHRRPIEPNNQIESREDIVEEDLFILNDDEEAGPSFRIDDDDTVWDCYNSSTTNDQNETVFNEQMDVIVLDGFSEDNLNDENASPNANASQPASTHKRLTAPIEETIRKKRKTSNEKAVDMNSLRKKQMELIDVQLKVQKTLLENAEIDKKIKKIMENEIKEKNLAAEISRKCVESDLEYKKIRLDHLKKSDNI